jgi:ABC-2 type transport system permease protein
MNIFNKLFLFLVLLPSALYKKMGISIPHLQAILKTKLLMDDRRVSSLKQTKQRKNQKPPNYATLATMFMTTIFGCVFLVSFSVGHDYFTQLTIYFSLYIFSLTSVLISDFTSVLIDVRDNMIILPKPINDKTFVLARLLHIVIHVSKLVLPMTLPGLVYIIVNEGLRGGFPFALMAVSATLFTIFLINAMYLLILKITTPEKFKNIISYFQIGFAIVFYAGYQVVPRLMSKTALTSYSITEFSQAKWVIPYWFAAGWQFFQDFTLYSGLWFYFVLTLLLPFASIWLVIKYFAPSFNRKLSMISGSKTENRVVKPGAKKISSTTSKYITQISKWITEKGTERMSFLQTWKITGRSREFKMKVYPTIGYLVVYLVLIIMKDGKILPGAATSHAKASYVFLSIIYFGSLVLMMALNQLIYSDKAKAAWIYYVTPIDIPGKLLSGALKATIVKFYLPIIVFVYAISLSIAGVSIVPNLLLATFNQFLIVSFGAYLTMRNLPFSVNPSGNLKSGGFIRVMFSMIVPIGIAILHFIVYNYTIVVIILGILSAIAAWMMMDSLKNKSWQKLQMREYEGS